MALIIDPSNVQELEKRLQQFTNQGLSFEEGLRQIHHHTGVLANRVGATACGASVASLGSTPDLLMYNVAELAAAVLNTNPAFTPLKIAILTKELYGNPEDVVDAVLGAFPAYTALEMGQLLLNEALYPLATYDEMNLYLKSGDYSEIEISDALNTLYGVPSQPIEVQFYEPTIVKINANVETGPGTMYNDYYKRSWIMHNPAISFIQIDYNHSKSGFSKVNLVMYHLTSMMFPKNGYSPIDILINGQAFKTRYDVVNGVFQLDSFDITSLVVEGNNSIRLNFCSGATTNYWIQNLKVDYLK